MASAKQCSMCQKAAGKVHCTGCDAYFCTKDYRQHRNTLDSQMDDIIVKRDHLQHQIGNVKPQDSSSDPLLIRISEWEKNTIDKVKHTANHARDEVVKLSTTNRDRILSKFKAFSAEMVELKESENFVESDLSRLQHMIDEFQRQVQQLNGQPSIVVDTERSDTIKWNELIHIRAPADETKRPSQRRLLGCELIHIFSLVSRFIISRIASIDHNSITKG